MCKSAPLFCALLLSLSARRAWIEICKAWIINLDNSVALRKESVDRNAPRWTYCLPARVALRKESVDRNTGGSDPTIAVSVALRKESVDRNSAVKRWAYCNVMSLSARRAWIEISGMTCKETGITPSLSARRAWIEIFFYKVLCIHRVRSLSARRAWIEITIILSCTLTTSVALRKESVDRNKSLPPVSRVALVALRKESVDRNNGHFSGAAP